MRRRHAAEESQFLIRYIFGLLFTGKFEDETASLPDFGQAQTRSWWRQQLSSFARENDLLGVLGGITLTRNSPYFAQANCPNTTEEEFSYVPEDVRWVADVVA